MFSVRRVVGQAAVRDERGKVDNTDDVNTTPRRVGTLHTGCNPNRRAYRPQCFPKYRLLKQGVKTVIFALVYRLHRMYTRSQPECVQKHRSL